MAADVRDPDGPLVARIAAGDQRAAAELVRRRSPRLIAIGRRMLGDAAEAEDVAQEVFMKVWRTAGDWTPGAARFETWMCRVAVNLCYDRLRKTKEALFEEPPERADEGPNAFDDAHARDVAGRVEQALAALPPRQRAVVALCHYQEMSNIEAAEVLEISVEAVESLLSRARRALRADLAGDVAALLERGPGAPG